MREEELKFAVHGRFTLPDLSGVVEDARMRSLGRRRLLAVYFDTPDLRLARAGVTLRHRTGEEGLPWQLKLATGAVNVREELGADGPADEPPPAALTELVTAWLRGGTLHPVATLRTDRTTHLLERPTGADGVTVLAEIVDDTVSVMDGLKVLSRFREVEVERRDGDADLLPRIAEELVAAGAVGGEFTPKVVRALGPRAVAPPDISVPSPPLPAAPAADTVSYALRATVRRLLEYDVRVRRDEPDAVHQMRVCCRRLRSDLRTFAPLVDPEWAAPLVEELRWLADALGGPRDAEVLRARLHATAHADPLAPVDADAIARMDEELAERDERARTDLAEAMRTPRYVTLLECLVDAANAPVLTGRSSKPATAVLPGVVGGAWRSLAKSVRKLDPGAPDEVWHTARKRAKRARYAAEAASATLGDDAVRLGKAGAKVQQVLGEHQDAAVAAQEWLDIAAHHPADPVLVLTAGRLAERERAAVRAARAAFAKVWKKASRAKVTGWLPA
ncbi:MAG TPA: CYTH and CHAD domain-containing protein [Cryptosporangiaceae bacterium]|nr:CYTH and CHAD domain-containing protein [Cryptosporangiaceae bacterium]